MKTVKLFLSLLVVFAVSVAAFAMPPENKDFEKHNKDFNRFEKGFCPAQFHRCEIFTLLELGPKFENEPKPNNFKKEYNFRFVKDLSQDQKDKIKQIREKSRVDSEKIMNDVKTKIDKIDEELSKEKYSQKTVNKLTKEIYALYNKKVDAKISERQQIRDILTSKQFSKMVKEPSKYDIFAERLNLTQEQQGKVEALFEKNKAEIKNIEKNLADKRVALDEEFNKENTNFETINAITKDIAELSKNKFQVIVDTKAELKKILNREQFGKMIRAKKEPKPIPVPQPIKPVVEEK